MEKIGFKIWNSDLAIGEEGNALVSSFLRKASEVIETEINEDGGIGGKQMTITSERVVKGEEGVKKVLNSYIQIGSIMLLIIRLGQSVVPD